MKLARDAHPDDHPTQAQLAAAAAKRAENTARDAGWRAAQTQGYGHEVWEIPTDSVQAHAEDLYPQDGPARRAYLQGFAVGRQAAEDQVQARARERERRTADERERARLVPLRRAQRAAQDVAQRLRAPYSFIPTPEPDR